MDTITGEAFGDYFPDADAFTTLLFQSYCTVEVPGYSYVILGDCKPSQDPTATLVIPCAIVQGRSNVFIEYGDLGGQEYNTIARLVLQKMARYNNYTTRVLEVYDVGNEGEGSAGYGISRDSGLGSQILTLFGTMADGCYFNLDNDKTTLDEGGLDCRYLVVSRSNDQSGFHVYFDNIGASFSVDEDGQLSHPGASLRYGVVGSVYFGEHERTPQVEFLVYSEGDATAYLRWDLNTSCGGEFSPTLDDGHFEDGDADDFFQSLEEAHEAYPDLFPLDTEVGLSATRKHFIRIS